MAAEDFSSAPLEGRGETKATGRRPHPTSSTFYPSSTLHDGASSLQSTDKTPQPLHSSVFRTPSSSNRQSSQQSESEWERSPGLYPINASGHSFGSPFTSPPPEYVAGKRRPRPTKTQSQQAIHPVRNYDSPFISPLPDRRYNATIIQSGKERPEPLVLDPSARSTASTSANSTGYSSSSSFHSRCSPFYNNTQQNHPYRHVHNHSSAHSNNRSIGGGNPTNPGNGIPTVQKLLQVATQGILDHHATAAIAYNQNNGLLHHATPSVQGTFGTNMTTSTTTTASSLAAKASHAGFLQKLGQNIPEFKRRFFVLKPESNLYYYLSPNDVEPRGRIDLEGSTVEAWKEGDEEDSLHRLVISWPTSADKDGIEQQTSHHGKYNHDVPRQIILEARSKEAAEEWIQIMNQDRVSTLKEQVSALTSETTAQKNRIIDLERQIDHYCMVEKDRDGALEDARNWRNKFEKLDEALRLLTQQIRKPPRSEKGEGQKEIQLSESSVVEEEEKKEDDDKDTSGAASAEMKSNPGTDLSNETDATPTQSNKKGATLLDDFVQGEMNVEEMLDVPGTYFSGLSNACRQQRESLRLATEEAASAVEDVVTANERVEKIQKRMEKAEKELLKLWEENCTVRKTLKQKKRERRVLVQEVKQLQNTVEEMQAAAESRDNLLRFSMRVPENDGQMADTMIGSDEERLIDELEEHVVSSIQLHERLLAGADFNQGVDVDLNSSMDQSISTSHSSNVLDTVDQKSLNHGNGLDHLRLKGNPVQTDSVHVRSSKSDEPKLLSLLDDDSDSDSSVEHEDQGKSNLKDGPGDLTSIAPSVSSTRAEMGDNQSFYSRVAKSGSFGRSEESIGTLESSPERPDPLLELDKDDVDDVQDLNISSHVPSIRVTDNGRATARLACPLADVADTRRSLSRTDRHNINEELQVQHITFYSKKIGIQFQKAPPAPAKPRGLLNDAMTADMTWESNGSHSTAAELRSVATITSLANGGERDHDARHCPLALPEDIVLVCGFQGFDDSGTNKRPKLGARLVAFDGVSVEVGKWTFDSIRKAIKARGRPLTLSFRNDFLTTEQRAVLTKAVMEVDAKRPPTRTALHSGHGSTCTASSSQRMNTGRGRFAHGRSDRNGRLDFTSERARQNDESHHFQPASSNSSLSSGFVDQPLRRMSSTSTSTHQSNTFRSFSESGSSVISASFAPLMANLLKGSSTSISEKDNEGKAGRFEPEYLRRQPQRSESTAQHLDFRSNLL
jgi:PH domain